MRARNLYLSSEADRFCRTPRAATLSGRLTVAGASDLRRQSLTEAPAASSRYEHARRGRANHYAVEMARRRPIDEGVDIFGNRSIHAAASAIHAYGVMLDAMRGIAVSFRRAYRRWPATDNRACDS